MIRPLLLSGLLLAGPRLASASFPPRGGPPGPEQRPPLGAPRSHDAERETRAPVSTGTLVTGAFLAVAALALIRLERGRRRAPRGSRRDRSAGRQGGGRRAVLSVCVHCRRTRDEAGGWRYAEESDGAGTRYSHGICPTCLSEHYGDQAVLDPEGTDPSTRA